MDSTTCLYLSSLASSVVILIFVTVMYCCAKCFYSTIMVPVGCYIYLSQL